MTIHREDAATDVDAVQVDETFFFFFFYKNSGTKN
jgi:hypothetical protein